MQPARQPENTFNWNSWKVSLDFARSAIEDGSAESSSALRKVLNIATRITVHCQHELTKSGKNAITAGEISDWTSFLQILSDDTWQIYENHVQLLAHRNSGKLLKALKLISEMTLDVELELQHLDRERPSKKDRKRIILKLRELTNRLAEAIEVLPQADSESVSHSVALWSNQSPSDASPAGVVNVPVVGRISAGVPILAAQSIEGYYPLPERLVGRGRGVFFILMVSGDSMEGAGINNGDWVVVRQQPQAENGEIVAALAGNDDATGDAEATIKRFVTIKRHAWLVPQNEAYDAIPADQATILGKVVAVLRMIR